MGLPEILLVFISILFALITVKALGREKQIEKKYQQIVSQNKRFVQAHAAMSHSLCLLDKEKRIAYLSPSMRKLLALEHEYISLPQMLERFPNPFMVAEHIEKALKNHIPTHEKDVQFGDSTQSIQIQPLIEESGRLQGVAIIFNDEHAVNSVTQMKEDFTKVISHELRSPLTTIKAASQFIRMQGDSVKETDRTKLLTLIDEQTEKLLNQVELILDSAKLEGKEFTIKPERTDMNTFLETTLAPLIREAEKRHIKLLVQVPQYLSACSFDKKHLGNALQHVISNSIKFTPPGEQIVIQIREVNDTISIVVSDTGLGIPTEQQATIFSRFCHISRPSENIGIGLGLYLTKGIIEAHGGQITLDSKEGYGTSVAMSLPIIPPFTENPSQFSQQN